MDRWRYASCILAEPFPLITHYFDQRLQNLIYLWNALQPVIIKFSETPAKHFTGEVVVVTFLSVCIAHHRNIIIAYRRMLANNVETLELDVISRSS